MRTIIEARNSKWQNHWNSGLFVGLTGFEPATFCSQSRRATKLRYSPFMHSRTWQVNTSFYCSVW